MDELDAQRLAGLVEQGSLDTIPMGIRLVSAHPPLILAILQAVYTHLQPCKIPGYADPERLQMSVAVAVSAIVFLTSGLAAPNVHEVAFRDSLRDSWHISLWPWIKCLLNTYVKRRPLNGDQRVVQEGLHKVCTLFLRSISAFHDGIRRAMTSSLDVMHLVAEVWRLEPHMTLSPQDSISSLMEILVDSPEAGRYNPRADFSLLLKELPSLFVKRCLRRVVEAAQHPVVSPSSVAGHVTILLYSVLNRHEVALALIPQDMRFAPRLVSVISTLLLKRSFWRDTSEEATLCLRYSFLCLKTCFGQYELPFLVADALRARLIPVMFKALEHPIFQDDELEKTLSDLVREHLVPNLVYLSVLRPVEKALRSLLSVGVYELLDISSADDGEFAQAWKVLLHEATYRSRQREEYKRKYGQDVHALCSNRTHKDLWPPEIAHEHLRLQRCSACKVHYFCSPACQQVAWTSGSHREQCQSVIDSRHTDDPDVCLRDIRVMHYLVHHDMRHRYRPQILSALNRKRLTHPDLDLWDFVVRVDYRTASPSIKISLADD